MGESLEVQKYERFTSLQVEKKGLAGGYSSVQPGDCIVAFSRKAIFAIKKVCYCRCVTTPQVGGNHPPTAPSLSDIKPWPVFKVAYGHSNDHKLLCQQEGT